MPQGGFCGANPASCCAGLICTGGQFCLPPPPLAFDASAGNHGSAQGPSPLSVPNNVVPGETAFALVYTNNQLTSSAITSISGGGTWSLIGSSSIGPDSSGNVLTTALYTNGASAAPASLVTLTADSSTAAVGAALVQYTGVGAVLSGNAVATSSSTTQAGLASLSLATTTPGSIVVAGFASVDAYQLYAGVGNLRLLGPAETLALMYNSLGNATGTVNLSVGEAVAGNWGGVAVEVTHDPPPPPLLCDCSNPIDVGGITVNGGIQNDDATIGLDPNVFVNPASDMHLDLPCGAYYLTGIRVTAPNQGTSRNLSISVHGNTALYVGDNIYTSAPLEITVDPTARLALFVGGYIAASQTLAIGNPEVPAQTSVYVGDATGVSVAQKTSIAGSLYVPAGPVVNTQSLTVYGSVFANSIDSSQAIAVHYDQALQSAGATCLGN